MVVATPDAAHAVGLAAFVLAEPGEELAGLPARLRQRVRERLPHYMVPEKIEVREVFPMTTTGKVDRQGLMRAAAGA